MKIKILTTAVSTVLALLLIGCQGTTGAPQLPDRPAPPDQRPVILPDQLLDSENLPISPAVTTVVDDPVSAYDIEQLISTFAQQYLGLAVTVNQGGGLDGSVTAPVPAEVDSEAVIALAGQVVAAGINSSNGRGMAEVAVGEGTISGDLTVDLSNASLGAYTLVVQSPPPQDAGAALVMIQATFPALAGVDLQPQTDVETGFVFATTTVDQSSPVSGTGQVIMTGTSRQGPVTVVWAIVGNGTFATTIQLPK